MVDVILRKHTKIPKLFKTMIKTKVFLSVLRSNALYVIAQGISVIIGRKTQFDSSISPIEFNTAPENSRFNSNNNTQRYRSMC